MLLLPMIFWWGIYYIVKHKKYNIDKEKWFWVNAIALLSSILTMFAFFYTYTQAFGIESLILNIFDMLLSITVGQLLGLHIYRYGGGAKLYISLFILALLIALFVIFTFITPHLPLFRDSISGRYGI